MINELAKQAHSIAVARDESPPKTESRAVIREQLLHLHSEVSEVYEAYESGDRSALAEELADVVIMALSLSRLLGVDIESAITTKLAIREARLQFR